jgi:hypothetical protein
VIRYASLVQPFFRTTTKAVELAGTTIRQEKSYSPTEIPRIHPAHDARQACACAGRKIINDPGVAVDAIK